MDEPSPNGPSRSPVHFMVRAVLLNREPGIHQAYRCEYTASIVLIHQIPRCKSARQGLPQSGTAELFPSGNALQSSRAGRSEIKRRSFVSTSPIPRWTFSERLRAIDADSIQERSPIIPHWVKRNQNSASRPRNPMFCSVNVTSIHLMGPSGTNVDGHRARTNGQPLPNVYLRARVDRMVSATIVPRRPALGDVGMDCSVTALAASAGKSPLAWKPPASSTNHGTVAVTSGLTGDERKGNHCQNVLSSPPRPTHGSSFIVTQWVSVGQSSPPLKREQSWSPIHH